MPPMVENPIAQPVAHHDVGPAKGRGAGNQNPGPIAEEPLVPMEEEGSEGDFLRVDAETG
jgi:hypothetical protein